MIKSYFKPLCFVPLIFGIVSCAGPKVASKPPPTVAKVDLKKYQGKWYEAARLPMKFQKDWIHSTAEYTARPDGTIGVVNRCLTRAGEPKMIRGTAESLDPKTNAKLEVTFNEWFSIFIPRSSQGNYWVLYLEPDYSIAAVGTPGRGALWILARQLPIPAAKFAKIKQRCAELGYDVSKLIIDPGQELKALPKLP